MSFAVLDSVLAAGSSRPSGAFITASEAARNLGRPASQIFKAINHLGVGVRGGSAKSSPIILTPADCLKIQKHIETSL